MGGDVDGLFGGEGGGVTGGSGPLSWDSPGLGLLAFGSVCTSIRVILNDEHSTGNIQVSASRIHVDVVGLVLSTAR